MVAAPTPVEIFCSYAREDEVWRQKLEIHLSLLKRQGHVSLWHDRLITPGTDWTKAIDSHLETASVILLFVSAYFFASDYCYGVEMKRAIERHEAGEARVIPILVRPVEWKNAPFAHLQSVPSDATPLSTWTNEDQALVEVVAGIRRVIEDLPLLVASAPRAALPRIWNIPYPRNPFFLGRESELAQVHQRLQAGQTMALSQPQAISGLGGIGKTQVALEYAYRYHQDYAAILWAWAQNTDTLISSYVAIASLLRLPEHEAKEQRVIVQAVKAWFQTHHDWLLILDNADELTLLPTFLPPSLGGHLILTTRAVATGRLALRLEIETLLPEQGALFLLRRAALLAPDAALSQAAQEERDLALHISQELGGLPLALDQAGSYLEETGMDLAGYWRIYQQYRVALLREHRGLVADHPAPVATTWSLSFERIKENNGAAELLSLCAYFAPDAISEEILTAGASFLGPVLSLVAADVLQLNQAIEALRAYSLVRRDPRGKTLSIHRLVQAVLQDAQEETERRAWAERAILAVNATFPHPQHGTWSQCERLLPQALVAAQVIKQYQLVGEEAGHLLHETATYLLERARYAEAEPLFLRALRIREQVMGPEHPDVAYPLNNLGMLYVEQGKYTEAEPLFLRALRIFEQQLGSDHTLVTYPLNNLGLLYIDQGKYTEAEPLFLRALRVREQQLGPDHPYVTYPLDNLATLYIDQGKYTEAEPLFLRVLRILEQQLEPDYPMISHPLHHLATLYVEQGKYAEAELLFLRSLHIREQQLEPEHPTVAESLNGLAHLYVEQGKYAEAEPLFLHALHIRKQALQLGHPNAAETMHNFARLREAQNNGEEARALYVHALAIREQVLGAQHLKTMETRKRLIILLHALGRHEEATQLEALQSEP